MQTKIIPSACRKVIEGNSYHYIGKAVLTTDDGEQIEYAIKTVKCSYHPEQIQIRIDDEWQVTTDYPAKIASDFADFLSLLSSCFGNKAKNGRNQLFLDKPRLLLDMTQKHERPTGSTLMTNYLCLIDGEFVHVGTKKMLYGNQRVYSRRPVDMSQDWEIITPTKSQEKLIATAIDYYKSKIGRYAIVEYRERMVKKGIWM